MQGQGAQTESKSLGQLIRPRPLGRDRPLALCLRLALPAGAINLALIWAGWDRGWALLSAGSGILWLAAITSMRYFVAERGTVPFLPAYTLVYFMAYGLPAFVGTTLVRLIPTARQKSLTKPLRQSVWSGSTSRTTETSAKCRR